MNKMKRILVREREILHEHDNLHYYAIGGLSLHVTYTANYPDELPEYEIETIEGQIPYSYYTKIREAVKSAVSSSSGGG